MKEQDLRTVVRLIHQERTYETELPNKSLYKLLYTVQKVADRKELDITIPYFWYQFGTISPVPTSTGPQRHSGSSQLSNELRPIVSDALQQYYTDRLEGITDAMYLDAPYDVQREFRELDKKIRTLHEDYPDFFEVEPSRDSIIDSVYAVYDSFPITQFREQEQDLSKWYTMFTREVDKSNFDPDKLMKINLTFWRTVSLQLAENHRNGMTKEEVKAELEITSFQAARESSRKNLRRMESRTLEEKFAESGEAPSESIELKAADAMMEPILANELGLSFSD